MNDLSKKLIAGLLALVIGMAGWYLVRLTTRIDNLTAAVTKLTIAVEIANGGDPFEETD